MAVRTCRHLLLLPSCFLTVARALSTFPSQASPYELPVWCRNFFDTPKHGRLRLGNLPTPLYQVDCLHRDTPFFQLLKDLNIRLYIKRDDASGGVELGGNKIRKLEFLLAEALALKCDSIVTIGGEQSNHCRATAAACRMVGLEPHLLLRSKKDTDLGLVGNLLMERMVGSYLYTCTPGEYSRLGSKELVARLAKYLELKGKRPYEIPVGGSNGLGSFGYINGVAELLDQWSTLEESPLLDHVVFACGSGGTAAGITFGIPLAHGDSLHLPNVHAVAVCDDPNYFYKAVAEIGTEMGFYPTEGSTEDYTRRFLTVHQGRGLGYAVSTEK
jgi:D-cysteine desulfhydrase